MVTGTSFAKENYKLRVSGTVIGFKEKAERIWGLEERDRVKDTKKPTVFFGMYHIGDYLSFIRHRGERIIFWCGYDILNLKNRYFFGDGKDLWLSKLFSFVPWHLIFKFIKADHYCENEVEADELRKMGIEPKIVPSFLEDINDFPVSFKPSKKPQVFLSAWKGREDEYGVGLVRRLAKKLPEITFHIYGAGEPKQEGNIVYHGRVSNEQFNREIKNYHCGLRPNEHDGFSEILAKSVLLGQYPVSKIKYPHIWNYRTENELVSLLRKLKKISCPNTAARNYYREKLNDFPWVKN